MILAQRPVAPARRGRDHTDDAVALAWSRADLRSPEPGLSRSAAKALASELRGRAGGGHRVLARRRTRPRARSEVPRHDPDRPGPPSRPRWAMRRICPFRSGAKSPRRAARAARTRTRKGQLGQRRSAAPARHAASERSVPARGSAFAAPLRDHLQHRRNGQRQSRGRRRRRERARAAADDLPELTIGFHHKRAATRLARSRARPGEAEAEPIVAEVSYPEWDWKRQIYRPSYCRVVAGPAPETGEDWVPTRRCSDTSARCGGSSRRCVPATDRLWRAGRPRPRPRPSFATRRPARRRRRNRASW